jgi:3-deoxy-7-phosphoheptulonate synthase
VHDVAEALTEADLPARLMIDCSHANSGKDHTRQPAVMRDVAAQVAGGDHAITGVMLESFLVAGRQALQPASLTYGQSITDACVDWDTTVGLLGELASAVSARRRKRSPGAEKA